MKRNDDVILDQEPECVNVCVNVNLVCITRPNVREQEKSELYVQSLDKYN